MDARKRASVGLSVAAFGLVTLMVGEAEARRGGLVVVNTGEDVIEIAELSAEARAELAAAGVTGEPVVGLMYARFGLFWLDLARWDPRYVVYVDRGFDGFEYEVATTAQLAALADIPEAEIRKPIRYYLPPGAVILVLVLLVGGAWTLSTKVPSRRRRAALMSDTRYQTAVAQYHGSWEAPAEERLAIAMQTLTSQGVSAREARANLEFLCGIERPSA